MKNRAKIKAKRKEVAAKQEEKLDLYDICGIKDPTPYEAVNNIIREKRLSSKRMKTA